MPTRPTPRILRLIRAALLVLLLLLSGCGTDPARPAAPVPTALVRTPLAPTPAGIWLPTRTPLPPTPTEPPRPTPTPTRPPSPTPTWTPIVHPILTPPAAGQPLIGVWGDAHVDPGPWGGNPIRMTATADGGGIQFLCYHGNFPPLVMDARGHFDVTGTSVREQAFPEPETPAPVATRYQGYLTDSTLVLTMTMLYSGPPKPPVTYKLPFVSMDPIHDEWQLCA